MNEDTTRKESAPKIIFMGAEDNVTKFRRIVDEMAKTYERKNHDYGDSFNQSVKEWGPVAGLVRIQDKFNRVKNLLKGVKVFVDDETVSDTLLDLANYAIMLRMALDNKPLK